MTTTKKVALFVKGFVAEVKGDDAEAEAMKALVQADSALSSQIPSLKGDTVDLKMRVTDAETRLHLATVNSGKRISDRPAYVKGMLDAQNELTLAQDALKKHEAKITFLEERLAYINKEVDSE